MQVFKVNYLKTVQRHNSYTLSHFYHNTKSKYIKIPQKTDNMPQLMVEKGPSK